ncbi:MAG: APC family permease [Verrucomicrobia bacterium]|nr:APC family permease [Verrucomicrobiota bacterium]MDA1046424.1 APC family permease [Verrucomicrobiota bacterium]
MTSSSPPLLRVIGLPGSILMGLGSIMGAGVFVSLGMGEQIAGPSLLLALALAAVVATCNGLSSAQLAANHPVSGGTYEYGHRWLTPSLGFTAGWMFLCAKSASAATAALAFAMYLTPNYLLPVSLATVVGLTLITLTGMQQSKAVNAVIVSAVLLTLLAFVAVGSSALKTNSELLKPFFDSTRMSELLEATALMFVAYTGYGRIATLGEEVREPRRTIPVAIILTLGLATLLHLGVSAVSLVHADGQGFQSLSLLAEKMGGTSFGMALTAGAALALLSVLLNLLLGLSRVALAMGRRGDLPKASGRINESTKVPEVATVLIAVMVSGLVCVGDVKLTWSFSAFTVLIYYAITNLCAIRLKPEERLYPVWTAYLGLLTCLSLAFFVEWRVLLTGLSLIALGLIWKAVAARQ